MTGFRRGSTRAWIALGMACSGLLLGGCVYLRLLELKNQLANFERHFNLQTDDGLRILCRNPVLGQNDVRWLGLKPASMRKLGVAEQWHVRWEKELPPGVKDDTDFYIGLDLMFAEGRLTGISVPESYFQLIPKSFVLGVIQSMGGADVDKTRRKVEARVASQAVAMARPELPDIYKVLGIATEEREEGPITVQRYRYRLVTTESQPGTFEMTLRFHTASGHLLHWHGRMPRGNIAFSFPESES
jgi:hypothetical protein